MYLYELINIVKEQITNEEAKEQILKILNEYHERNKWWEEQVSWILSRFPHKDETFEDYKKHQDNCKEFAHRFNLWLTYGYGDIYSFDEFYNCVKDGSFIDYDGIGDFIDDITGKKIKTLRCNCKWLKENKPENSNYVMWYNK